MRGSGAIKAVQEQIEKNRLDSIDDTNPLITALKTKRPSQLTDLALARAVAKVIADPFTYRYDFDRVLGEVTSRWLKNRSSNGLNGSKGS